MNKVYYSYTQLVSDCKKILPQIKQYNPDAIISIARGGMIFGNMLSSAINLRELYIINSILYEHTNKLNSIKLFNIPDLSNHTNVLIVDDIIDSGDTMYEVIKTLKDKYPQINIKCVSIFHKTTAKVQADFKINETKDWINFFWEVDLQD